MANILAGAFAGLHAALALAFNAAVRQPFMDEQFHVPQAQAYCALDFDRWDPKITTFPGLYVLSSGAAFAASWLGRLLAASWLGRLLGGPVLSPEQLCTLGNLRAMNALLGALIPVVCYAFLRERHPRASRADLALNAAAMAAVPPSFFFHFLFYTDTASTLLVLLGLWAAQRRAYARAAAPLGAAVLMRQSNAVWALFVLALGLIAATEPVAPSGERGLAREILSRVRTLPSLGGRAWLRLAPLCSVALGFAAFVCVNRGVVVGDRSNHVPANHLAQLLYFSAFAAAFGDPSRYCTRAACTAAGLSARARAQPALAAASVGLALMLVRFGTVCHPFLLADNRHYTFYVWKALLRRPAVRYAAALGYAPCAALVSDATGAQPRLWRLAFAGCCALVLVPSPLIEPRYFILPYLLLRLHAPLLTGARELTPALALVGLANAVTIGVFLCRPWRWPDGSEARFMW